MVKTIAKIAEKTAKNANSSCWAIGAYHQPKMPASLINKNHQPVGNEKLNK